MIKFDSDNPRGIIWIASYPRSGNTWMRAFINSLFKVMRDPASADFDINKFDEAAESEGAPALYPRFLGKPVFRATPAEIAAARPWVQAALVESARRLIYLKTHNARAMDHGAPLINTDVTAGSIYIVRNPLDVAISYAHLSNAPIDFTIDLMARSGWGIETTAQKIRTVTGSWSQNVGTWTDRANPTTLVVRYEDMLDKPERTFKRIARHLRTDPTKDQLRQAIELSSFDRLRAREAEAGFFEKPDTSVDMFFREGRAGQWQERLSAEQVARIVKAHKPAMRRFGYLPAKLAS
ncbi:sulfotransferase domain-containing protein [Bauldia litoralis]|uniref:sulfotransferase domain-containing protein n=1 Tax=Bauldia litoralis TaxID=665467 RepID=UPI003265ABD4